MFERRVGRGIPIAGGRGERLGECMSHAEQTRSKAYGCWVQRYRTATWCRWADSARADNNEIWVPINEIWYLIVFIYCYIQCLVANGNVISLKIANGAQRTFGLHWIRKAALHRPCARSAHSACKRIAFALPQSSSLPTTFRTSFLFSRCVVFAPTPASLSTPRARESACVTVALKLNPTAAVEMVPPSHTPSVPFCLSVVYFSRVRFLPFAGAQTRHVVRPSSHTAHRAPLGTHFLRATCPATRLSQCFCCLISLIRFIALVPAHHSKYPKLRAMSHTSRHTMS